jgi:hypothetical protein
MTANQVIMDTRALLALSEGISRKHRREQELGEAFYKSVSDLLFVLVMVLFVGTVGGVLLALAIVNVKWVAMVGVVALAVFTVVGTVRAVAEAADRVSDETWVLVGQTMLLLLAGLAIFTLVMAVTLGLSVLAKVFLLGLVVLGLVLCGCAGVMAAISYTAGVVVGMWTGDEERAEEWSEFGWKLLSLGSGD